MGRGQEILAALAAHFTGRCSSARKGDDDVFRVGAGLHAEAAADVADQHAHLLGRQAQTSVQSWSRAAEGVWVLMRKRPRRPSTLPARSRLHRDGRQALVDEVERDDMRGVGEGRSQARSPYCVCATTLPVAPARPAVRRAAAASARCTTSASPRTRPSPPRRRHAPRRRLADHRDHRLADEMRLADRQDRARRRGERRAAGPRKTGARPAASRRRPPGRRR